MRFLSGVWAVLFLIAGLPVAAATRIPDSWPQTSPSGGESVEIDSFSPFVPAAIGKDAPPTKARLTWYAPKGASAANKAPAVVLLHGAGGVSYARENTYAAQLASMGIGAVVVDVFAARRDLATSFVDRIIEITETMALADAYATLAWLQARPEIDASRVALWGFSYGAMSSVFAANAAIADKFSGLYGLSSTRFAAHIAFYGPCITEFDEPRTTGAPMLLAWGSGDELIDAKRCDALIEQLRSGGSKVRSMVYEGAAHQWDGGWSGNRRIGRQLNDCRFRISRDLEVRSGLLGIGMSDPTTRKIMLALCVGSEGYVINADEKVRMKSNSLVGEFLNGVFRLASR